MIKQVKLIFTFLLIIFSSSAFGQDSIPVKPFILFGFDLYGPVNKIIDPTITNYEGSITLGKFKKLYPTIEAGYMNVNRSGVKDTLYHYYSNGKFARIGFDYNIFKRKRVNELYMVFVGCRYGFAQLSHNVDNIYIQDNIWGEQYTPYPSEKYHPESPRLETVKAQWFEITAGIKAEIFKNFAMGWSVRYRILTHSSGMDLIKPMYIPGYGSGTSTTAWGFNYSIYYIFRFQKQ